MYPSVKRVGRRALKIPVVAQTALGLAAVRGRGAALVYHRVTDGLSPSSGVVPVISQQTFRSQLDVLQRVSDVVPLASLIESRSRARRRPRVALTFDDDSITHHDVVLPILQDVGVTATFFVGGRSLHGLGSPWFEILDALILARGVHDVARWLGTPGWDAAALAESCERDVNLQRRLEHEDVDVPEQLAAPHLRALADAGMAIGFHTLHHRLLTDLPDVEIDAALTDGKETLEGVLGEPIRSFAYPHGKTDARVVARVPRAGYLDAWTGRPGPIRPGSDPFRLSRFEPGELLGADLVARLAVTLSGRVAS